MTGSKVAVVTGGSRGIGRAVAERLAGDGVAVAVRYAASSEAALEIGTGLRLAGGSVVAVRADVADPGQAAALFDQCESEFGGVDIVVASAGIMRTALIAEATDKDFTEQVDVNVPQTFNALRQAGRRVRDDGRVLMLSGTALALNAPGYGAYNALRGAVEGSPRDLAKGVGPRGVTVNAVAPGPAETDLFLADKSARDVERLAGLARRRQIGQPADIADEGALRASSDSGWTSGQVIRANGPAA